MFFPLIYGLLGHAQKEPFSRDSLVFIEEIDEIFQFDKSRKAEAKEFMEGFRTVWLGGFLDTNIRNEIYDICDKMREKRMLPFPEYSSYLSAVAAFVMSGHEIEKFDRWHRGVEILLDGRSKRKYTNFLVFSRHLFEENALFYSSTTVWKSTSPYFEIYWKGEDDRGEAIVEIESLDLACYAKHDSSFIWDTKGTYYPMKKLWVGEGGVVNWHKAGFEENQIVAHVGKYKVEMNRSEYFADSAEFTNKLYFGNAVLIGELNDKVIANNKEDRSHYPKFSSYKDNLTIKNIFPKVDYNGGFKQKGVSFIGIGSDEKPASVIINRNGKPFIMAFAESFVIRESKLFADPAEVFIFLDGDTVYHPGVNFKFDNAKRELDLYRNKVGRAKSPYFNKYHEVDMYVEVMQWNIDGNMIHMEPLIGSTQRDAMFESSDFYQAYRYDDLYGLGYKHPLVLLKRCVAQYETRDLELEDVAHCWKLPPLEIKRTMMILSNMGYVRYNFHTNTVHVQDKAINYVLARVKKIDYDIIQFKSKPSRGTNADLNLDSMYMQIHGVPNVLLSDSHNVILYPTNGEVLLKKNRDFDFSGVVVAGRLEFFGTDFKFHYDSFYIEMPHVDSMRINVQTEALDERTGKPKMARVHTVIQHISGRLEVDKHTNKSGKIPVKRWPVFTSYGNSYAYYDKREPGDDASNITYDQKELYFELDPFSFDSLDNFQNSAIGFEGKFVSGGIFEDFREKLVLNEENISLGFVHQTGNEGKPIYGGKGTFTADIHLSKEGLLGDGYIDYITSISQSERFKFYLEHADAVVQEYVIEEQYPGPPEYPAAQGQNLDWHWRPYQDTMLVSTQDFGTPINMYDGSSTFKGKLIYNPDSLVGTGVGGKKGHFEFDKAITESNNIRFKFFEFFSDTADFALKIGTLGELGFDTKNMRAHVSFKDRIGHFWANGESSEIVFTKNQYKAKMDEFTWFMDEDKVDLTAKKKQVNQGAGGTVDIEGAKLTCIKKHQKAAQDSLYFYSSSCKFDLKEQIITADEVKFINVADAEIIPDSGRVVIYKDAVIKEFKRAQIVANRINRFHKIYDAELVVKNKIEYSGKGKYDYKNGSDEVQVIEFQDIHVSPQTQTLAHGLIGADASFTLSPRFKYKGDVNLEAGKELLEYEGTTQLVHDCKIDKPWIKFKTNIDPTDVMIPIDSQSVTEQGRRIHSGQLMGSLPAKVYSAFASELSKPTDKVMSMAKGVLMYNSASNEYRLGDEQKVNIPTLLGNYLTLNTEQCVVFYEGSHTFGSNTGRIEVSPVSTIRHVLKNDSVVLNTSMLVDFFFEDKAIKIMSKDFQDATDYERIDYENPTYVYGLKTLVGETQGEKIRADIALLGKAKKFPAELEKPFYFSNIKMYWNPQKMAFQSIDLIGYGNSGKGQVNKLIKGNIEIKKKRSGDRFAMYLKVNKTDYYYFSYANEVLETVSTNTKYNLAVKEAKKNKQERTKGQAKFRFVPTQTTKAAQFLRQL
ncbi:MAG: hypothetical protein CL840_11625 [Crocinitomicaceae bacterium]|nr:hypothetical protein [Crocinitomicaceae bacterium]